MNYSVQKKLIEDKYQKIKILEIVWGLSSFY